MPSISCLFFMQISQIVLDIIYFCDTAIGEIAVQPAMQLRGKEAISKARPGSM